MTFTYPAVFTPKKEGAGYYVAFPDLEGCEAQGPDLEDAIDNAADAAYKWKRKNANFPRRRTRMILN